MQALPTLTDQPQLDVLKSKFKSEYGPCCTVRTTDLLSRPTDSTHATPTGPATAVSDVCASMAALLNAASLHLQLPG